MRERPILFRAPMVLAILEGRKTQTRRVIKPHPELSDNAGFIQHDKKGIKLAYGKGIDSAGTVRNFAHKCPYGQPGDRLWVRENWLVSVVWNKTKPKDIPKDVHVEYQATDESGLVGRTRPSIHMPRWASRITLEITSIRVERLQDISEAEAIAEGIEREFAHNRDIGWKNYLWHGHFGKYGTGDRRSDNWEHQYSTYADGKAVGSYSSLWEFINGPGSWDSNPWVWVIEFKRVWANK